MGNEGTKKQIRDFLERAIEKVKNPSLADKMEKMKKERINKQKKIIKNYGF